MSRLNIKGQMSRLRQNICYASLLACGERSARALRAFDCYFWIENSNKIVSLALLAERSIILALLALLVSRSGLPLPSTMLQFPDHGPSRPQPRMSNFSLLQKNLVSESQNLVSTVLLLAPSWDFLSQKANYLKNRQWDLLMKAAYVLNDPGRRMLREKFLGYQFYYNIIF